MPRIAESVLGGSWRERTMSDGRGSALYGAGHSLAGVGERLPIRQASGCDVSKPSSKSALYRP